MTSPSIDVRELPVYAFGRRDPLWWGIVFLMLIEGTGFLLLLGSYFYVRSRADVWPPVPLGHSMQVASAVTTAVLAASVLPTHQVNRAAYAGDLVRLRRWQFVSTAVTAVAVVCRALEFRALPVQWDTNAYGSLLWAFLVLHTTHVGTGAMENVVLSTLLVKGPVERKHLVDLEVNGLYWYFVVGAWVPIFAVFYLEGLLVK
jgi:cytochrome c oxidase subunit 3